MKYYFFRSMGLRLQQIPWVEILVILTNSLTLKFVRSNLKLNFSILYSSFLCFIVLMQYISNDNFDCVFKNFGLNFVIIQVYLKIFRYKDRFLFFTNRYSRFKLKNIKNTKFYTDYFIRKWFFYI